MLNRASNIQFVSPCCGKPIVITSLDEVRVVLMGSSDDPFYGWNTRCCQDSIADPSKITEEQIANEKLDVFRASVKQARVEFERQQRLAEQALADEIERFEYDHNPEIKRHFVSAIWGNDSNVVVENYRVAEHETEQEADQALQNKVGLLQALGYFKEEVIKPFSPGMLRIRRLVKRDNPHQVRFVGYWREPIA